MKVACTVWLGAKGVKASDLSRFLTQTETSAKYTKQIWKRARKWNGIPTGITQQAEDMLKSSEARAIITMNSYGDTVDQAAMPLLAINDGPMLTMIAMGIGGLADIPFMALVAAIGPILVGMILGNIDKDLSDFLAPAGTILLPFVGFCLGAGMNLTNIAKGGAQGILLGLVTCLIGGAFIVLCDRFISRRPGYAGWAVATTAGNAVAVPAVIAEADPSWAQWADVATSQVAASAILTAILVPIITSWWAKKFGCPKFPKDEAQKALFEKH